MKLLKEIDVKNKKVLLRTDFNVVMDDGKVKNDFRIKAVLPTIEYLRKQNAKILILSHLGRPKPPDGSLSLKSVASHLADLLDTNITFFENTKQASEGFDKLEAGQIAILENLRFNEGEESANEEFAFQLASLGDVFVNDAFGVAHREHASITLLPKLLPHAGGFLMEREVEALDKIRDTQERPLVFIYGGAKVKTKLRVFEKLFDSIDAVCFGGLIANTILHTKGVEIGKSRIEKEAEKYLKTIDLTDTKINLPLDVVVSKDETGRSSFRTIPLDSIKEDELILDAGPETLKLFFSVIEKAEIVVWNGPLGLIEVEQFRKGTIDFAKSLKEISARIIVGGGDLMQVIEIAGVASNIDHQSTGGGSMLEYLADGTLPGIIALR